MSLYDDIITGPNAPKIGSSPGIKLLQEHLKAKKRGHSAVSDSSGSGYKGSAPKSSRSSSAPSRVAGSLLGGDWDPRDEYDPLWPNEYDIVHRLAQEDQEKQSFERVQNKSKYKLSPSEDSDEDVSPKPALRGLQDYSGDEDEDCDDNSKRRYDGKRTKGISKTNKSSSETSNSSSPAPSTSKFGISSVAAKIMSKMGYREGQGLGKGEQGMISALEVEKTGSTVGKIVESARSDKKPSAKGDTNESIAEILKNPTRVVLLRNMVGPGEVDDELDGETKEECSKYGEVVKCLIFEIPKKRVPDDEAVRIFVEFKKVESAIRAVVDLNGRFFGGRVVKASFYDVDKFNKFELAGG